VSSRRHVDLSTAVAAALGRHTAIYAASFGVGIALQLVNLGILTRYLSPSEFGKLGIALVAAALLTVLYNLGSLQGALSWAFGASDEGELEDATRRRSGAEKRRALGTALILTLAIVGVGTALIAALARPLASLFLGDGGETSLVLLVGASGAAGAIWRLVVNIPRLELRPVTFAALNTARPLIVLGISLPLVMEGHGVSGVLVGTAGGTALAAAAGLVASRRSFAFTFSREDLRGMMGLGRLFIPIVAAFWIIQNVDLLILSQFASHADVGLYRAASRIGGGLSYLVSAFLMAWAPLRMTPLFAAAEESAGQSRLASLTTTYFALLCFGALLVLILAADALIRLAGPEYREAAPLIPLLGLAFLASGAFIVIYRGVRMPRRRQAYPRMAVVSAVAFLVAAFALTPAFGVYGAAVAPTVGFAAGSMGLVLLARRADYAPFEWRRILIGGGAAAACVLAARLFEGLGGAWTVVGPVAALVAYPLLLLATGVVSRAELRQALEVTKRAVGPSGVATDMTGTLEGLSGPDRALLRSLARNGESPADVAAATGMDAADVIRRLVALLRAMVGLGGGHRERDLWLGALLTSDEPPYEREARTRRLVAAGIPAAEIEALTQTMERLRFEPAEAWGSEPDERAAEPPLAAVPGDVPSPL
jgi:O-antigen/teichoic acid export membrane protein